MTILIVWDRMGDYHRSRVEAYRSLYRRDILYTADIGAGDQLYHWDNTAHSQHVVLSQKKADDSDVWQRFKRFKQLVNDQKMDKVVLSGYGRREYLLFSIWLKLKGIDCYMFAESWYAGNAVIDRVKGWYLNAFVKGIFVSGIRAKAHFHERLAYPEKQLQIGYSVVDNAHFKFERSEDHVARALGHKPMLLCVARYAEEKNLEVLIKAFEASKLSDTWGLTLVGGGPLESALKRTIRKPEQVQLLSWQAYEALPSLYQNASCFVLPSRFEPWGLVVNEAMAASLPIIISDACGCAPDLLDANGYVFKADEQQDLVEVLNDLSTKTASDLYSMGLKSFSCISNFSPHSWSESLNKLIQD